MREIKIRVPEGLRTIGNYDEKENKFICSRSKTKHLFKTTNSWGLDSIYLNHLAGLKGNIELHETDEGKVYKVSAEKMKAQGKYMNFKGNRLQVFLPLSEWDDGTIQLSIF